MDTYNIVFYTVFCCGAVFGSIAVWFFERYSNR